MGPIQRRWIQFAWLCTPNLELLIRWQIKRAGGWGEAEAGFPTFSPQMYMFLMYPSGHLKVIRVNFFQTGLTVEICSESRSGRQIGDLETSLFFYL